MACCLFSFLIITRLTFGGKGLNIQGTHIKNTEARIKHTEKVTFCVMLNCVIQRMQFTEWHSNWLIIRTVFPSVLEKIILSQVFFIFSLLFCSPTCVLVWHAQFWSCATCGSLKFEQWNRFFLIMHIPCPIAVT